MNGRVTITKGSCLYADKPLEDGDRIALGEFVVGGDRDDWAYTVLGILPD